MGARKKGNKVRRKCRSEKQTPSREKKKMDMAGVKRRKRPKGRTSSSTSRTPTPTSSLSNSREIISGLSKSGDARACRTTDERSAAGVFAEPSGRVGRVVCVEALTDVLCALVGRGRGRGGGGLVVVLDNLGRQVGELLRVSLRRRRLRVDRHGRRRPVHEVGRRRIRAAPAVRRQEPAVAVVFTRIAGRRRRRPSGDAVRVVVVVLLILVRVEGRAPVEVLVRVRLWHGVDAAREMEPLDRSGTLLRDVPNDVGDGVGLVLQVPIGDVGQAHLRSGPDVQRAAEESPLELGLNAFGVHQLAVRGAGAAVRPRLGAPEAVQARATHGRRRRLGRGLVLVLVLVLLPRRHRLGPVVLGVVRELGGPAQRADNVLHVVSLSVDEAAQVHDDALGLLLLTQHRRVLPLERRQVLLVLLPLALELLGDLLLQQQRLERLVALLLRAVEPVREPGRVVLVLLDEAREATVLALGLLNLDLEVLRLFGELLDEDLEFEELSAGQRRSLFGEPPSSPSAPPALADSPVASSSRAPRRESCCAW